MDLRHLAVENVSTHYLHQENRFEFVRLGAFGGCKRAVLTIPAPDSGEGLGWGKTYW